MRTGCRFIPSRVQESIKCSGFSARPRVRTCSPNPFQPRPRAPALAPAEVHFVYHVHCVHRESSRALWSYFLSSVHPETPDGDAGSFRFEKEGFFALARKSRGCAEAYLGTPHKQARSLTPPGRKRTLSGWKLSMAAHLAIDTGSSDTEAESANAFLSDSELVLCEFHRNHAFILSIFRLKGRSVPLDESNAAAFSFVSRRTSGRVVSEDT